MSPASRTSAATAAAALLSVGGFLAHHVQPGDGHVYMMSPISRQLWGTTAFQEQGSGMINYCPHCFQSRGPAAVRARGGGATWPHYNGERAENGNYIESEEVAKRHGVCGDPEQTAAEGDNRYGLDNSNYPVLETFAEGGILEVKVVVSTYHWGHVEMFLCDTADLPSGPESAVTQSCFNKYPLDRAEDDEFNGPIDPNNRGRFILDPPCRATETDQEMVDGAFPGDVATARFQLPQGVTCDRCVVQMVYYTGNSCKHQGYAEFNPTSWPSSCAPAKENWINEVVSQCGDGDSYPEEFWNCSDIEITSDGGPGTAPAPTSDAPAPTPEPVEEGDPTSAPSTVTEGEYPAPTTVTDDDFPAPTTVEEDDDYPAPTTVAGDDEYPAPTTVMEDDDYPAPTTVEEDDDYPAPTTVTDDDFPAPTTVTDDDYSATMTVEEDDEYPAPTTVAGDDDYPAPTTIEEDDDYPAPTTIAGDDNYPAPTTAAADDDYPAPTTVVEDDEYPAPTTVVEDDEYPAPTTIEEDDYSAPTTVVEDDDYPAPTTVEEDDYDMPAPSPMGQPEMTSEPSVASPVSIDGDCDDPVAAYDQCGGRNYQGSTCCMPGYECMELAKCYSECRPAEDGHMH